MKYLKLFETFNSEKTVNEQKKRVDTPDISKFKKFAKDFEVKDKANSDHKLKSPFKWDVDDFKEFVEGNLNSQHEIAKDSKYIAEFTGLPMNTNIIEFLNDGGSGLNNNEEFNKYGNWGSALYDIWKYIKSKI